MGRAFGTTLLMSTTASYSCKKGKSSVAQGREEEKKQLGSCSRARRRRLQMGQGWGQERSVKTHDCLAGLLGTGEQTIINEPGAGEKRKTDELGASEQNG
mmetsp:Transcript_10516/g.28788  ORF Transcript_10516/g.28788 Transcript_10516/m.28788 type:complete len:100 (+) Transcript_10516:783-1082(+)